MSKIPEHIFKTKDYYHISFYRHGNCLYYAITDSLNKFQIESHNFSYIHMTLSYNLLVVIKKIPYEKTS